MGKTAEIVVPEEPEMETAPAESAPELEPATPPSKYAGKSQEELARMLEEQERYLGRLGNELGDTRQQAEYWRQQMEATRQARVAQEPHPAPVSNWDWEKFQQQPDVTIESLVDRRLQQAEQYREERDFQREAQRGRQLAMKERPGLFKGIEDKVDALVANGKRGGFVNSSSVGDPETWYYAAGLLKMRESNFNFGGVNPVQPTQTERPTARRQTPSESKEQVEFDDKSLSMVKGLGFSETRAAEILRGEPRKTK
jgi:hypothetical protein